MVFGAIFRGLAVRVLPFVRAGASKALPAVRTVATAVSRRVSGAWGKVVPPLQRSRPIKSLGTSGLINIGITAAALGGGTSGALAGGLLGGKGRRIRAALFGGAIGSVTKKLTGGGGLAITPSPKATTEGGTGGEGIIKNEQTSIPGTAGRVSAPRRRTTRRRATRRGRGRTRRRTSMARKMARVRSFRRKGRRTRETWGPRHKRRRSHRGGRSGHGRHQRVSFMSRGKRVTFTAHRR